MNELANKLSRLRRVEKLAGEFVEYYRYKQHLLGNGKAFKTWFAFEKALQENCELKAEIKKGVK